MMATDRYRPTDEARVLVIYTGGTIGMLVGPQGYRNEPHFLTETLRCQSRFHDPQEDSLFSQSRTVDGFRRWSTSGRASPVSVSEGHSPTFTEEPTLTVKSTRPISHSFLSDPAGLHLHRDTSCKKVDEGVYECALPSLVTPRTSIRGGPSKRIRYAILEWEPLLDSSNVETHDWVRIATEIELNYPAFDAFVILHGTDTMAYTASALSFMLEDLGKTVILTGAQIPLSKLRNDGMNNFLGALSIAGQFIIPECCVFFNQSLYRGNRVSKVSSYDLDAFDSPNFPPLVNVGIDIVVNWDNVIRQTNVRRFKAHKDLCSRVATLRLFPGISAETIRTFLKPPIQGVVLETFGAGNAPQRQDLMDALREAAGRCVIVAITQCTKGTVSNAYETGQALIDIGVVPGGDMTPESALAKLGYLLSKPQLSLEKVRELVSLPLRGELTVSSGVSSRPSMAQHLDTLQDCLAQMMRLSNPSASHIPEITISTDKEQGRGVADDATASWSWTAAEAGETEATLLNILIRLAVAKDDPRGLDFCLRSGDDLDVLRSPNVDRSPSNPAAGVVNTVDPTSGWTPLHVAAFNGSERCTEKLLQAGALVHLRDSLGHTPLYYAARRGHSNVVEILRQAGANLGCTDIEGGFVALEVRKALQTGDDVALEIWRKAGHNTTTHSSQT